MIDHPNPLIRLAAAVVIVGPAILAMEILTRTQKRNRRR
jgi:hypothetical protein